MNCKSLASQDPVGPQTLSLYRDEYLRLHPPSPLMAPCLISSQHRFALQGEVAEGIMYDYAGIIPRNHLRKTKTWIVNASLEIWGGGALTVYMFLR